MKLAFAAAAGGIALVAVSLALLGGFALGAAGAAPSVRPAVQLPPIVAPGQTPAPVSGVAPIGCALPAVQTTLTPAIVVPGGNSLLVVTVQPGGMLGAPANPCAAPFSYAYTGLPVGTPGHMLVTASPTAVLTTAGLPIGVYPILVQVYFVEPNGAVVTQSAVANLQVFPIGPV